MPLTKTGKKVLRRFRGEYGFKHGTNAFYGYMRKHPKKTKRFHRT